MHIDWGDAPGWFEAIGTVGTFIFAFAVFLSDRRRAELSEARKVVVWQDKVLAAESADSNGKNVFGLVYVNNTGIPIQQLIVWFKHVVPPTGWDGQDVAMAESLFVAPAAEPAPLKVNHYSQYVEDAEVFGGHNVKIRAYKFTDPHGRAWLRDGVGSIKRVDYFRRFRPLHFLKARSWRLWLGLCFRLRRRRFNPPSPQQNRNISGGH